MPTMKKIGGAFVFMLVLAAWALVSDMDYADAKQEQAQYCQMVKLRKWPDYRHTYRTECTEKNLNKSHEK